MGRLISKFDYSSLYSDLQQMRGAVGWGEKYITSASMINFLKKIQSGEIDRSKVYYKTRFFATFPRTRKEDAIDWMGAVQSELAPKFSSNGYSGPPIKQIGPYFGKERISISFEIRRLYTSHRKTLENFWRDCCFLLEVGGGHSINHAETAEAILTISTFNHSVKPVEILDKKIQKTSSFGRLSTLHDEIWKELYSYYANDDVAETIYYWLKPRHPMVETIVESGEPIVVRYESHSPDVELKFRDPRDVCSKFVGGFDIKFANGRTKTAYAGSFFFSVNRIDSENPNILFCETDVGSLLKVVDPQTGQKYNGIVAQELLNTLTEEGLNAAVQFSGSRGFHALSGQDGELPPKAYFELVEKFGRSKKREYLQGHYAFNTLTSDVLGYLVNRRLVKKEMPNLISIDPVKKGSRIEKILIDHSSNKLWGEIRCPGSRHLGSGGACRRIEPVDGKLPEVWYDATKLHRLSDPDEVIQEISSRKDLYQYLPQNSASTFEKFFEKYYDIYALLLWITNKVEKPGEVTYTRDDVLSLNESKTKNILSFWLHR